MKVQGGGKEKDVKKKKREKKNIILINNIKIRRRTKQTFVDDATTLVTINSGIFQFDEKKKIEISELFDFEKKKTK